MQEVVKAVYEQGQQGSKYTDPEAMDQLQRRPTREMTDSQPNVSRRFLPARRYASAGTSYDPVSVSVSVSITTRCSIKMTERTNLLDLFSYMAASVFNKLTYLLTEASFDQSDARPLQFIAEVVKLGLQQDFVARVN